MKNARKGRSGGEKFHGHAFCFFISAMVNQPEKRRGTADNLSTAKVSGGFARHKEG
jgi:hypothetical protein